MYGQIDLKVISKIYKTKDRTFDFHEFSTVNFIVKNVLNFFFPIWTYSSCESQKIWSCEFLRLTYKKVIARSYDHFPKFICVDFLEKWFLQLCQKWHSFVQKPQGVLGINVDIEAVFLTCVVVAHAFMMGHIAEEVA
jgi:hypothetical protein